MKNRHDNDSRLRELFESARKADRADAPGFRDLVQRKRPAARGWGWANRSFRIAAMATAGSLAIAATSAWLYLRNPEAILPPVGYDLPAVEVVTEPEKPAAVEVAEVPVEQPPVEKKTEPAPPVVVKKYVPPPVPAEPEPEISEVAGDAYARALEEAARKFPDLLSDKESDPERLLQETLADAQELMEAHGSVLPRKPKARERDFKARVAGVSNVDPGDYAVVTGYAGVEYARAKGLLSRSIMAETLSETDPEFNTEAYDVISENEFLTALENPLSTFSIDVDTASYSNIRRHLANGELPPANAVRIEEMINYFRYDYPAPTGDAPFSASVEIADCPWKPEHRLARIGLKGKEITRQQLAGSNLVFLIDVSGSMEPANKLPLLKSALSLLTEQLDGGDRVAIVVYAGSSGLVLPSTSGSDKSAILSALDRLHAGGSTNGGSGLKLAYKVARENFIDGGVNRVILATDGDFNVGITDRGSLLRMIKKDARSGIFLTTLGFGMGNYKDNRLETLADQGNGNHAYIDSLREARKVLVEQIGGTLVTIAKDVKIQVEFNPIEVGAYRLIGYENRMLRKEDFNDDTKDAGEIGAGHTVTALYEIVPAGMELPVPSVDPLKYQTPPVIADKASGGEMLTLKIRYKEPDGEDSRLLEFPIMDEELQLGLASEDFKFAAAVAEFGMILRESKHKGEASLFDVRTLALEGIGSDEYGYRSEFVDLVNSASALMD
jgi:Ca-activated chloride channel family protein